MMPMQNPFPTGGTGLLGAFGGIPNYKVEQRPDGTYIVAEITAEDVKRDIQAKIDPKLAPFVNVRPSPRGLIIEVKL